MRRVFRAGLTNKVVTELKADGEVVMKESGPSPRDMQRRPRLRLLRSATHRANNALIEGNFHYKDPKNEARAIRANYDIFNDHVVLTAEPGFDPTVIVDGQTLKAKQIEFSPHAGTAKATGAVIAQLVSRQNGPAADSTTVFPASKPVFVNSDSVSIQQATKIALFSGHVKAWQETNTIFSQEMQVQGDGRLRHRPRRRARDPLQHHHQRHHPRREEDADDLAERSAGGAEERPPHRSHRQREDRRRAAPHDLRDAPSSTSTPTGSIEKIDAESKVVLIDPPSAARERATRRRTWSPRRWSTSTARPPWSPIRRGASAASSSPSTWPATKWRSSARPAAQGTYKQQ